MKANKNNKMGIISSKTIDKSKDKNINKNKVKSKKDHETQETQDQITNYSSNLDSESTSNLEKIPNYNNRNISIYLIKNIFSFIDKQTIFNKKYLYLNKQLFGLFNLKAIQVKIDNTHEIGGTDWMDTVYCEYDFEQICKEKSIGKNTLKNIFFEIESKDQGWASVNESSSFVILRIVEKANIKIVLKSRILIKNFAEPSFKQTNINLKVLLKDEFKDYVDLLTNKDSLLQIVGKSEYPGWLCYIRKCNAKLNLLDINH
jgi:hypothetical protein